MTKIVNFASALLVAGLVASCAPSSTGLGTKTLAKGQPISIRALVAAHPGQQACTDYRASSNSCASLITSRISGNTLIATETAVVNDFTGGGPKQIQIVTQSRIQGDRVCVSASGIRAGSGSQSKEVTQFVVEFTKDLVRQSGGVCGTYYEAGDGYVVSSTGGNGRPFPPGDTAFQYVSGTPSLRVQ